MDVIENEEVANILIKNLIPKDFEKDMYGEVFTPVDFICKMLDELPPSVWKNPSLKWFDPASGIGNFPIVIYYKLMKSLPIINREKRSIHIIEKMLFMNEINKKNANLCKKLFSKIDSEAKPNIESKDFMEYPEKKYDIIVGNPPYNEARVKETSDQPLYSKFIVKSIGMTSKLLFVVPSRWFSGGKGLADFRKSMLSRKDIVSINHISNSRKIWPSVSIKGGINYFYLDNNHNGLTKFNGTNIALDKYDILVPQPKAYSIINKVMKYPSIEKLYLSTSYFGITTNFLKATNNKNLVKCYFSAKKGGVKYIASKYIKNTYDFWKVFTPQGSGIGGDGFGSLIIGTPNEIASQTYLGFAVNTEAEAKSLKSYLETDFANFMLSLRKIDQHISENTLKWVPLPPLDRIWNDAKINKYYNLSDLELRLFGKTRKKRKHNNKTMKIV
jgi:type I restriction-modification system DNA methylase subunit